MKIPAGGVRLVEAQTAEITQRVNLVMGALREQKSIDAYPEALYPDRVVLRGSDGRLIAWPYSLDADNKVAFGAWFEVVERHVPAQDAPTGTAGASALVEAVGGPNAGRWLIRVIRAGLSGNRVFYPDSVLREAAPLLEGVRVFAKPDAEHVAGGGKDVMKLIGGIYCPRFVEGKAPDSGEILAELQLIEADGAVAVKLREASAKGMAGLFGFSIDADGKAKSETRDGKRIRVASAITRFKSVDLIVEPGAGGELIRLIEAVDPHQEKDDMLRDKLLQTLKAKAPAAYAKINPETATDDELVALTEALAAPPPAPAPAAVKTEPEGEDVSLTEALQRIEMIEVRGKARMAIADAKLPEPAKDRLRADFDKRERFVEADVGAAIEAERTYLARFTESGKPVIHFDDIKVEDRAAKMDDMLDAFFDPAHKNHREVRSFKECYVEMTGDRYVTGLVRDCDQARMVESFGARFREAVSSGTFANALGNSITRRMQAIFLGLTNLQAWRKVAVPTTISDFRTQERFRIGGYGNLPVVAEGAAYAALSSPGDAKATYAAKKRGGTETITREAIKNDDVRALMRIPQELALAAANTLYEFVFDFFRTNPTIYDAVALYHASHANLFTAGLSATEFAAHRLAMVKQARAGSAKRLGVSPATVLVPFELQETAYNLFVRNQNLDKTYVQSINPEVIPVAYWTDANDWCTVASPNEIPVVEVGFMDGREEPDLFVQDMPNVGSLFSNDQVTYKIRHEYDGAVLVDGEKGTTKAVVP